MFTQADLRGKFDAFASRAPLPIETTITVFDDDDHSECFSCVAYRHGRPERSFYGLDMHPDEDLHRALFAEFEHEYVAVYWSRAVYGL